MAVDNSDIGYFNCDPWGELFDERSKKLLDHILSVEKSNKLPSSSFEAFYIWCKYWKEIYTTLSGSRFFFTLKYCFDILTKNSIEVLNENSGYLSVLKNAKEGIILEKDIVYIWRALCDAVAHDEFSASELYFCCDEKDNLLSNINKKAIEIIDDEKYNNKSISLEGFIDKNIFDCESLSELCTRFLKNIKEDISYKMRYQSLSEPQEQEKRFVSPNPYSAELAFERLKERRENNIDEKYILMSQFVFLTTNLKESQKIQLFLDSRLEKEFLSSFISYLNKQGFSGEIFVLINSKSHIKDVLEVCFSFSVRPSLSADHIDIFSDLSSEYPASLIFLDSGN